MIFSAIWCMCLVGYSFSALSSDIQAKIISYHNGVRNAVAKGQVGQPKAANMKELSWDNELAEKALKLAKTCKFNHDTFADRKTNTFPMVGQNLCTAPTVEKCMETWFQENKNYDYMDVSCKTGMCGHYTQMAWANTYKIGCDANQCPSGMYLVCDYGPAGNEVGSEPYVEGNEATQCPSGSSKIDGLCRKP